jgi:Zn finger protein HypA/HybF involved in hydrogenase expression
MHEHHLAKDIFHTLQHLAEDKKLKKITHIEINVGLFHNVEPEFLIHSFEHAFEGTFFECAAVVIKIINPGDAITDDKGQQSSATGREIIIRSISGE